MPTPELSVALKVKQPSSRLMDQSWSVSRPRTIPKISLESADILLKPHSGEELAGFKQEINHLDYLNQYTVRQLPREASFRINRERSRIKFDTDRKFDTTPGVATLDDSYEEFREKPIYNTRVDFQFEPEQDPKPATGDSEPRTAVGELPQAPVLPENPLFAVRLDYQEMLADLKLAEKNHEIYSRTERALVGRLAPRKPVRGEKKSPAAVGKLQEDREKIQLRVRSLLGLLQPATSV